MIGFILRRLLGAAFVLVLASFIVFALLDVVPGDAAQTLAGESASVAQLAELRRELGLDRPLAARYVSFLTGVVFHGDLGQSLVYNRPVLGLVAERFLYTLRLTFAAVVLAVGGGLGVGVTAARRAGSGIDLSLMTLTALSISLPVYWVALLLVLLFSLKLDLLPVVGADTPLHLVLPAVCLALPTGAMVARLTRASLLDVSRLDYVRTAYAKGLSSRQVWNRHVLRNALIPVVTMVGLHLGHLLGGAFVVETLFAWPGLGRMVVQAIFDRDFPLIVGAALLMAGLFQVINLAVDLAQLVLDPRLRQEPV